MAIIGTEIGPACTPKDFKKRVVWYFTKQAFKGSLHFKDTGRHAINEETSSDKCITPVSKRNISMRKQG